MTLLFYNILESTGFNWTLAREVFYNLTDLQLLWLEGVYKYRQSIIDKQRRRSKEGDYIYKRSFRFR